MKRIVRSSLLYVVVGGVSIILFMYAAPSFAQELRYDITKGEYQRRGNERVYIVGKIVNVAYELQHRPSGAQAQDSLFSKGRQGLMTSGGMIWNFVDNVKGQDLQWNKVYLDKFVKVHGWAFHDAQYVEVDSFSIGGEDYVWSNETNSFQPAKTAQRE